MKTNIESQIKRLNHIFNGRQKYNKQLRVNYKDNYRKPKPSDTEKYEEPVSIKVHKL